MFVKGFARKNEHGLLTFVHQLTVKAFFRGMLAPILNEHEKTSPSE